MIQMKKEERGVACRQCGRVNKGRKVCKYCGFDMFEEQVEHAGYFNAVIRQMQIYQNCMKRKHQPKEEEQDLKTK